MYILVVKILSTANRMPMIHMVRQISYDKTRKSKTI